MEAGEDASLFLARVLEELDGSQSAASYQELCRSLCARLDLPQLARLRGLLFHTACRDPCFPATLFQDKLKRPATSQPSEKGLVAADIVAMFSLAHASRGAAQERRPLDRPPASFKAGLCDAAVCEPASGEQSARPFSRGSPAQLSAKCRPGDGDDRPQFVPACEPNFLLGVHKEGPARGAPLDRLPAHYGVASPQPCEMQRTYFPMNLENESMSDPDSLPPSQGAPTPLSAGEEPFGAQPCVQKRHVFKENFHDLAPASPGLHGPACLAEAGPGEPQSREQPPKTPFLNHSFDLPFHSQYLNPLYSPLPDKRRAKHESLDDLQASTYFGPSPVRGAQEARRCPGRPGRQSPWPAKSWSLSTEEVPGSERSLLSRRPSQEQLRYPSPSSQTPSLPSPDRRPACLAPQDQQPVLPAGYTTKPSGLPTQELPPPVDLEPPGRRLNDRGLGRAGGQLSSDSSSVGTQTEQRAPEPRTCRDAGSAGPGQPGDRLGRKQSEEDSDAVGDDISDIFGFLDDLSLSGSTGAAQPSRYSSAGSLAQLPGADGEGSLERGPGGRAGRGARPRGSLLSEEELRTSVCRLALRVGEIERKLESLSGVREEICQVLGKLSRLDQRMQRPARAGLQVDQASLTSEAPSEDSTSPQARRAHGSSLGPKRHGSADWCCSDASGANSESLRVQALKKSLFARPSSRSLTEENSATESKIASVSNSPRDWRTITYPSRGGLGGDGKDGGPAESRPWHRRSKEVDRLYEGPAQRRPATRPEDGFLAEQVLGARPHPASLTAHLKSGALLTDLRPAERGQPSWTLEDYARTLGDKGKPAALDLQTQESLNPNNLEYWLEDAYTPGYDSLLKRKEAEFRRAKVCKLAALVAAAACTVVLVVVVPICTMKS